MPFTIHTRQLDSRVSVATEKLLELSKSEIVHFECNRQSHMRRVVLKYVINNFCLVIKF